MRRTTVSPRESQILAEVGRGRTNREIAATFTISEGTVKSHLHRVFKKLGVTRRADAVRVHLSSIESWRFRSTDRPMSRPRGAS
ncbi:MAG: helix-turn-helix transcriptional regulator [Acidobacteria bacterium]|nr:helix-turn-helix transcriptional regulator [Acidobacteriota bacterium]